MPQISLEQARAAKKRAVERFKNLGSVGITRVRGEYAVKLNLTEPAAPDLQLPSEIDGVPLCVEVVGVVRPR
jgi:hypothetical protein